MKSYRALYIVVVCGLGLSCQQDPFQLRNYGDGGPFGDGGNQNDALPRPDLKPTEAGAGDFKPFPDLTGDACAVQLEVCNGVDDNCNKEIDEGIDKLNDARYCENCKGCKDLLKLHAFPGCSAGKCVIASCEGGYIDFNKDATDGCELQCTPSGVEICDGIDNDCNKIIDDGVQQPPQFCQSQGACSGAKATCKGTVGWQCEYGGTVELATCTNDIDCGAGNKCTNNKCPNLVASDEKKCDGIDGDCDGLADDPWANQSLPNALGKECDLDDPPKLGACRNLGTYVCDTGGTKVMCKLKTAGKPSSAEVCNGQDDDCDGTVDDNLTDEQWVNTGSIQVFKYEASRGDATSSTAGILSTGRPCSVPGRLPWGSITKEEAQAACKRAGARLCTTAEWEAACKGSGNTKFPYGASYVATTCNGRAYDTNASTTTVNEDEALTTEKPTACVSTWGGGSILNMSGNLKEWTATSFSGGNPSGYEIKGGAYDTPSLGQFGEGLSCEYDLPAPTAALQIPTLGFRCCK